MDLENGEITSRDLRVYIASLRTIIELIDRMPEMSMTELQSMLRDSMKEGLDNLKSTNQIVKEH